MAALRSVMELHTRLLLNCLEDVDDDLAVRRADARTNHLAFLALHLLDSRWYALRLLGGEGTHPFTALLEGVRSVDELRDVPPVEEIRAAWRASGAAVDGVLSMLTAAAMAAPMAHRFPVRDRTVGGALGFLVSHEAYHMGQAAFLRRQLGLPAMRYGEAP